MICPVCEMELKSTRRHGVTVDYCPRCRGVWLDRGELDKIIQRTMALAMPFPAATESQKYDFSVEFEPNSRELAYQRGSKEPPLTNTRSLSYLADLFD